MTGVCLASPGPFGWSLLEILAGDPVGLPSGRLMAGDWMNWRGPSKLESGLQFLRSLQTFCSHRSRYLLDNEC